MTGRRTDWLFAAMVFTPFVSAAVLFAVCACLAPP